MAWESSSNPLAEKHPLEAVLLGAVSLSMSVEGIVGQVLGYGGIRVKPDVGQSELQHALVGLAKQSCADTTAPGQRG